MTPESKIKKEIVAYLDSLGERCWHVAYHNIGYGRKGVPDRLVCYRGRFIALEVKSEVGIPTAWQEREMSTIREAGGLAHVVRNVDDTRAVIEAYEQAISRRATLHVL